MVGVIVNTLTVILGSTIGLLCRKGIPARITDAAMTGIGLCTVCIGFSGVLSGTNTLIMIGSVVLGGVIGTLINIDGALSRLGDKISARFKGMGGTSLTQGFVTACLMFCVGSMTVVGSLNSGLLGDNQMIYAKSMLDFISSMMLSASLGPGVMLAAAFVFVFQGALVMLSSFLQPVMTEAAIAELTCAGSVLILALGLNILGITKIKVADYLPAIVTAPVLCMIASLF